MSKAGQSTITGVSAQADAALVYLLSVCDRADFMGAYIEGTSWEDFTLIFRENRVDFEVKWHERSLSWPLLRSIVKKELKKKLQKDDRLGVVAKTIDKQLYGAWEALQGVDVWWKSMTPAERRRHRGVKPFLAKKFTLTEVEFLRRTNLTALRSENTVRELVVAHFAFKEPFYLTDVDADSLIARCFRDILTLGAKGKKISRQELRAKIDDFVKAIAEKSETFTPDLQLKDRVVNLKDFLVDAAELKKLNHERYITPISVTPRLAYYLLDELERRDFHVSDFTFLIEKVFRKDRYLDFAVRLLEKKFAEGKCDAQYVIKFIDACYSRMRPYLAGDTALGLAKKIAEQPMDDDLASELLALLKKRCLTRLSSGRDFWRLRAQGDAREGSYVADILLKLFSRLPDQRKAIEFVFQYFNFTADDFELMSDTPPAIYQKVESFLSEDLTKRYSYVLGRVNRQFQQAHGKIYEGSEHIGSGVSQSGDEYAVTDIGVVRFVFGPAFRKAYEKDPAKTWPFFRRQVLDHLGKKLSLACPSFIFRSIIPVLIQVAAAKTEDPARRKEAQEALRAVVGQKFSIHNTSDFVFSRIADDKLLSELGPDYVMLLIKSDLSKYKKPPKGPPILPTSIFAVKILVILAAGGTTAARGLLLRLAEHPLFPEWDRDKDTLEQFVIHGLIGKDPDFGLEFVQKLGMKRFLSKISGRDLFGKNAVIRSLLKADWESGRDRAAPIIQDLLSDVRPDERAIKFATGMIPELLKIDASKTYALFAPYLGTAEEFRTKFWEPHSRDDFAWLAEALFNRKEFGKAQRLLRYLVEDPDPKTDRVERDFNYHLQVLKGEEVHLITSARGTTAWVLRRLGETDNPALLMFGLKAIETLLDLDGSLARKLGYAEPDQYVRGHALIALATFTHLAKRKFLEAAEPGLGEKPKKLTFAALTATDELIERDKVQPKAVLKHLAYAFNPLRDLCTDEARTMLDFFERRHAEDSAHLFVYYAVYRKKLHAHVAFDSGPFEERLQRVCKGKSDIRASIAHYFWQAAEAQGKGSTEKQFDLIEGYWLLLGDSYEKEVFDRVYRTLEITLGWDAKYPTHKEYLKKLIEAEQRALGEGGEPVDLWGAGRGIADQLAKRGAAEFLDVFHPLVANLPANVRYWDMSDWAGKFEELKGHLVGDARVARVEARLDQLFPEKRLGQ